MNISYEKLLDILHKIPLFGALNREELDFILPLMKEENFPAGEIIVKEGGSPNNLYIIVSGNIKVAKRGLTLTTLGLGDSFGEVELIGILPYIATCTAATDVTLLVMPKRTLYAIKNQNPSFFIKIILNIGREVCRRLARADVFIIERLDEESDQLNKNGDYY